MGYDLPLAALPSFLPCNSSFFFSCFFFMSLLIISTPAYASKASAPLCLSNQSAALLQFKQDIVLLPSRLSSWKKGTNCCHWEGVTCDKTGFPTALQISSVSNMTFYLSFFNSTKLDPSLFELSHLRVLDLRNNGFGGEIPKRLGELTHLTHLDLSYCLFEGAVPMEISQLSVPMEISQLSRLVYLSLSGNNLLLENNRFTNLVRGLSSLQHLALDYIHMSSKSVSVITMPSLPGLQTLSLNSCNFSGILDESILQLRSLAYMNLSGNQLFYIPEFFQNFTSLRVLKLQESFIHSFPSGIFLLPELEILDVYGNDDLVVSLPSKAIPSSSNIQYLDLSYAKLHGDLAVLSNLTKLTHLYLPNSSLSYASNNKGLTELEPPNSSYSYVGSWVPLILNLSSCNIDSFPTFLQKVDLDTLDLSNNRVRGKVPSWLWRNLYLVSLILNHNNIDGFEAVNGSSLQNSQIRYFSALNNRFVGEIPTFICNWTELETLDMSNNGLTSTIPKCLGSLQLKFLILAQNQLQGHVPLMNATLSVVKLNNNLLSGKIGPTAFHNCINLVVLDLGNNQFNDTFPSWLSSFPNLKVLVLRANHLHGPITLSGGEAFSSLHILDISGNHLSGPLPQELFTSLKDMMVNESKRNGYLSFWLGYHTVPVVQTVKGRTVLIPDILNSLFIIDLSSNMFSDKIPDEIGMLEALILLNISNNNMSGTIPESLGNLQQMEALDLSYNHLSGGVPMELSNLTFLEVLNLSYNDLHGSIPQGKQFSTFDESSFEGNPGLCGSQVHRSCSGGRDNDGVHQQTFVNRRGNEDHRKKWEWIGALGIGFAVGLFMITLPTLLIQGFSNWYWNLIERVAELLMQGFLYKSFKFKPSRNAR
ncbi:Receptor-like protein 12 [Nymphaea thermarum]|nr:Receptor-like protein 12 [Nymphaea thermarum]